MCRRLGYRARLAARLSAVALALAASCTLVRIARADEKADLEKGRNAYLTRQYVEADARFRAMLDPASGTLKSPELVDEARMYWGAVFVAMKRPAEAEALFSKILRGNPEYQPDPLTFSTAVLDTFTDTRVHLKDELNAQKAREAREDEERRAREAAERQRQQERIARLERLAAEETVVERHSRWIALLPFGVGQFQNGRPGLGAAFAISEGALVVASAATFGVFLAQRAQAAALFTDASAQYNQSTAIAYNQYAERANVTRIVNLAVDGALVAVAVAGVAQAQFGFVGDVSTTRPRARPAVAWTPTLTPLPSERRLEGVLAGVTGRF